MDPPSKKRSIFGFGGLFRSSTAPADNEERKDTTISKPAAPALAPPQRELNSAPAPHSPMKRASESQLASRKFMGRPQGPSSKLSQSISASDIAHRPSGLAGATLRRMPGDNPNKPPRHLFASTVSHAPTNVPKSTSFSGVTSTPRNVFRSSSFPPTTPGRPARGSSADVNGRILSQTASTELFKMRIPSPPRHLTGEMLAKEVPSDPNRSGSIYADEFLAHYCPPDLDEHQRRQFFCILDLRRLKYAADEVFTRKDWKINILNFAKEYEKSRSLIMLRYGLYEFKTVRASEAVKKEWKQKHGIPDSDDEADAVPKINGTSKRKASEDLGPGNASLMESISGGNKRARAPEVSAKNKRKADEEPEENHPAKLQKSTAPPSATKSFFESVANNTQSSISPTKPAGKSLFASTPNARPNGRSLFDATPKPAATGNIFGHLSDESKGSGNEGADEDSETSSNAEEDQSEGQDDHAASGGVSTPQFGDSKMVNGTSSASSDAGESIQGRSIFDRITRGNDGQPLRKLPPTDGNLFAPPAAKERSVSPLKEQPAAAPINKTWSADTPIKFAAPAAPALWPAGTSTIDFGASTARKADETTAEVSKESTPQNMFAAQTKKPEEANTATAPSTTPNLFSSFTSKPANAKPADAPAVATPSFGGFKPSASTSLFGSAAPAFGQQKASEEVEDSKAAPPPKSNLFQSSTTFGAQNKTEVTPAATPQFGALFGKPQTTEAQADKPASSFFSTDSAKPAGNLFGGAVATTTSSEEPAAKKFAFGGNDNKTGGSLFGSAASTPAAEPAKVAETSFFGAASTAAPATEAKSLFGSTPAAPATQTPNLFGASTSTLEPKPLFGSTTAPTESKPLFGGAPASAESKPLFGSTIGGAEAKPLFGSTVPAAENKPLFGNTPSSSGPIFSFGGSATPAPPQPAAPQQSGSIFGAAAGGSSFSFAAGGSDSNAIKNPFSSDGSYSAPSSFNFGSDAPAASSTPFAFGGGAAATPTISFGGAPSNTAPGATSGPLGNYAGGLYPGAEQISLVDGGPGEEDESAVHEVRAKALKLVTDADSDDDESGGSGSVDKSAAATAAKKSPWKVMGLGPLRLLKHKTTGAVRMLMRAEPRGNVALNKAVLPNFAYKADNKYVKVTTAADSGKGLETWMLQVKTADAAKALAAALEEHKNANKKED
ncbi:hypothetical protein N0V88_001030 [Collariella sp. IMI 366227]|nr:hypothetical protein N0V88_001030 [Collariella sp. IMI 366227]